MTLWRIRQAEFGIFAVGDERGSQMIGFLKSLEASDPAEFAKVQARLDQTSHNGPPRNRTQCNTLGNGCFELKTTNIRIACFWDSGNLILCSHAFRKKGQKTPKLELKRLYACKDAYFSDKTNGREKED